MPKILSSTHILLAAGSLGLCIAWVVKNYSGFTLDNGTYHFLLMTLFIIFTSVGATSFRIFTFVSRPVAKVLTRFEMACFTPFSVAHSCCMSNSSVYHRCCRFVDDIQIPQRQGHPEHVHSSLLARPYFRHSVRSSADGWLVFLPLSSREPSFQDEDSPCPSCQWNDPPRWNR